MNQVEKVKNPIFIIGCPRSGNTLIGAILNKHPDLLIFFENNTFSYNYLQWKYLKKERSFSDRDAFISIIYDHYKHFNDKYQITKDDLISTTELSDQSWGSLLDSYMNLLMNKCKNTSNRWGDKTPHNLGFILDIQKEYPNAQFIYTYRDPRAVISSLSNNKFNHNSNDPYINAEFVKTYLGVYDKLKFKCDCSRIYEQRYEDLVDDPEAAIKKICKFLDIEYIKKMMSKADTDIKNIVGWENDKAWGEVTPQVSNKALISENVEAILNPSIVRLGYESRVINYIFLRKIYFYLKVSPFLLIQKIISIFWKRKHSNYPFIMQKYPGIRSIVNWVSKYN